MTDLDTIEAALNALRAVAPLAARDGIAALARHREALQTVQSERDAAIASMGDAEDRLATYLRNDREADSAENELGKLREMLNYLSERFEAAELAAVRAGLAMQAPELRSYYNGQAAAFARCSRLLGELQCAIPATVH